MAPPMVALTAAAAEDNQNVECGAIKHRRRMISGAAVLTGTLLALLSVVFVQHGQPAVVDSTRDASPQGDTQKADESTTATKNIVQSTPAVESDRIPLEPSHSLASSEALAVSPLFNLTAFYHELSQRKQFNPTDYSKWKPVSMYRDLQDTKAERMQLRDELRGQLTTVSLRNASFMVREAGAHQDISLSVHSRKGTVYALFDKWIHRIGTYALWYEYCVNVQAQLNAMQGQARKEETANALAPDRFLIPKLFDHHLLSAYTAVAIVETHGLVALLDLYEVVSKFVLDFGGSRDVEGISEVIGHEGWFVHGMMWGGMLAVHRGITAGVHSGVGAPSGPSRGYLEDAAHYAEAICRHAITESNVFQACIHGMGHGAYQVFHPLCRAPLTLLLLADSPPGCCQVFGLSAEGAHVHRAVECCSALSTRFLWLKCSTGLFHESANMLRQLDLVAPGFEDFHTGVKVAMQRKGKRGFKRIQAQVDTAQVGFEGCDVLPAIATSFLPCLRRKQILSNGRRGRIFEVELQKPEYAYDLLTDTACTKCRKCDQAQPLLFTRACVYLEASVYSRKARQVLLTPRTFCRKYSAADTPEQSEAYRDYLACIAGYFNLHKGRVTAFTAGVGMKEDYDKKERDAIAAAAAHDTANADCLDFYKDDGLSEVGNVTLVREICNIAAATGSSFESTRLLELLSVV